MLTRLAIRNFQAIGDADYRLGRITTIVGPTDTGKSSTLRALRWAACNTPQGMEFVRDGANGTRVRVRVEGRTVGRTRTAKDNIYTVGKKPYRSFRTGVPSDVADLFNLDPNLNFQWQHDAPFWFAMPPGQVAQELNRIVDLGAIDAALGRIRAVCRKANARVAVAEEAVELAVTCHRGLAWVPGMVAGWRAVEQAQADTARLTADIAATRAAYARACQTITRAELATGAATGARRDWGRVAKAQGKADALADALATQRAALQRAQCTKKQASLIKGKARAARVAYKRQFGKECPLCGTPLTEPP